MSIQRLIREQKGETPKDPMVLKLFYLHLGLQVVLPLLAYAEIGFLKFPLICVPFALPHMEFASVTIIIFLTAFALVIPTIVQVNVLSFPHSFRPAFFLIFSTWGIEALLFPVLDVTVQEWVIFSGLHLFTAVFIAFLWGVFVFKKPMVFDAVWKNALQIFVYIFCLLLFHASLYPYIMLLGWGKYCLWLLSILIQSAQYVVFLKKI